jgi:hypothetical protein
MLDQSQASMGMKPGGFLRRLQRAALAGAAVLGMTSLLGCVARAGVASEAVYGEAVYGYPTYVVEAPPPDVQVYPRIVYRGSYAYLIGDRWYYQTPRGWVVFREEPVELRRHRETLRRRRPPPVEAPREERRRYYPQ